MKKGSKKKLYLAFAMVFLLLGGCTNKTNDTTKVDEAIVNEEVNNEEINNGEVNNENTNSDTTKVDEEVFKELVVTVGDEKVYYSEAMLYIQFIKTQYESYFGSEVWGYDFGGQTFGDMAKQDVMNMITQTKIVSSQVDNYNVVLTDEEELNIVSNSNNLLSNLTEDDKTLYGFTQEVVDKFYRDNKLYERVFEAATLNVDTEVSDEEAKQITVQHILVQTQSMDENGVSTPFSDEEKQKAFEKATGLLEKAKETEDFYTFASTNTEDSNVEYTFGRGEMVQAFEETAFNMKTGDLSELVETEYGYHILYCVNDFNEDATLAKKETIIGERQNVEFQDLYKEWATDFKVDINEDTWAKLSFTAN